MKLKSAILVAAALVITNVSAASANDALAVRLGLEPGVYTLSELVQIMNTGGAERKMRIYLIDRQKSAFRDRVAAAVGGDAVVVTRALSR